MKKLISEINKIRLMMGLLTEGAGGLLRGIYNFDSYISKKASKHAGDEAKLFDELKIKSSKSTDASTIIIRTSDELKTEIDNILSKEMDTWTPREKQFVKEVNSKLLDDADLKELASKLLSQFESDFANPVFKTKTFNELGDIMDYNQVKKISDEIKTKSEKADVDQYPIGSAFKTRAEENMFREWLFRWEKVNGVPGWFTADKYKTNSFNTYKATNFFREQNPTRNVTPSINKNDLPKLEELYNEPLVFTEYRGYGAQNSDYIQKKGIWKTEDEIVASKPVKDWKYYTGQVSKWLSIALGLGGAWWLFDADSFSRFLAILGYKQARGTAEGFKKSIEIVLSDTFQETNRNAPLVRDILEEKLDRGYVKSAFGIELEDYAILDNASIDKIAEQISLLPSQNKNENFIYNTRGLIYGALDGIDLILVSEKFKTLSSNEGKLNIKDFLIKKVGLSEDEYFKVTEPNPDRGMIFSALLQSFALILDEKQRKEWGTDKDLWIERILSGKSHPDYNVSVKKEELIQNGKKFNVLSDYNNWTINGVDMTSSSEANLQKALATYFYENSAKMLTVTDLFDIVKIVGGVNDFWPKPEEQGKVNIKNKNILQTGELAPKDLNPLDKSDTTGNKLKNIFRRKQKQNNQQNQQQNQEKPKKKSGVAFENYNVVGLGKLLIENQSTTGDFDWRAALFQNFKDITEPSGWKGNPKKKVNQTPQNGWGTFDSETKDLYDTEVEDGSYPKELIDQVEKVFFKIYNKKFRFELNDSGDFITLQGNPSIYQSILDTLNYGPTQDFEAIFFMGIMKIKEYKGTVTSIQVSDATAAILKKNELIIKQIINPKDK